MAAWTMNFRYFWAASFFFGVVAWAHPVKNLIVLGQTGAGKSHFCNEVTGTSAFQVGHDILNSCTSHTVSSSTGFLVGNPTTDEMSVTITDTGWFGDTEGREEAFLDDIAAHVRAQGGAHGIVYIHNACEARLHKQARDSLKAMVATLANNSTRSDMANRVAIVFTKCTEKYKRVLWEKAITDLLCEDFGVCKVTIIWYDDFQYEESNSNVEKQSPSANYILAPLSSFAFSFPSDLASSLQESVANLLCIDSTNEQANVGAWRGEFAEWVMKLPTNPIQVPSESERERLKREYKEETKRQEKMIQNLHVDKKAAEDALKELEAQVSVRDHDFYREADELRKTIRDLRRKLNELRKTNRDLRRKLNLFLQRKLNDVLSRQERTCFSGESTVLEKKLGLITVKDLEIGNEVATADGWSPVTTFLHWHRDEATMAFKICHAAGNLTVTGKHLVFVVGDDGRQYAIPARDAKPGQTLLTVVNGTQQTSQIHALERTIMAGYYAPLTTSGTIVVDDVVASCYTQEVEHLLSHRIIHSLMTPLRILPTWLAYQPKEGELHPYVSLLLALV